MSEEKDPVVIQVDKNVADLSVWAFKMGAGRQPSVRELIEIVANMEED